MLYTVVGQLFTVLNLLYLVLAYEAYHAPFGYATLFSFGAGPKSRQACLPVSALWQRMRQGRIQRRRKMRTLWNGFGTCCNHKLYRSCAVKYLRLHRSAS